MISPFGLCSNPILGRAYYFSHKSTTLFLLSEEFVFELGKYQKIYPDQETYLFHRSLGFTHLGIRDKKSKRKATDDEH